MTTKVAQIEVGPMSNFSYIIADDNSKFAAIVDPSWDLEKILTILEKENWQAKMIINTHNHFDHIQGNEQLAAATGDMEKVLNPSQVFRVLRITVCNIYSNW